MSTMSSDPPPPGAVSGTTYVGGLVRRGPSNPDGNGIVQSYWDSYTTGQRPGSVGALPHGSECHTERPGGATAANYAFKQSAYGNFDFTRRL